jgi:predicted protein tyrosine phosphatase
MQKTPTSLTETYEVNTIDGGTTIVPTVVNLREARILAREFPAVITAGPTRKEANFGHPNHLIRTFDDVTHKSSYSPTASAALQLVEFGAKQTGPLLIHCHAGMSRSTATAIGVLLARGVDAIEALETLSEIHPIGRAFIPNPLILGFIGERYGVPNLPKLAENYEYDGPFYGDYL